MCVYFTCMYFVHPLFQLKFEFKKIEHMYFAGNVIVDHTYYMIWNYMLWIVIDLAISHKKESMSLPLAVKQVSYICSSIRDTLHHLLLPIVNDNMNTITSMRQTVTIAHTILCIFRRNLKKSLLSRPVVCELSIYVKHPYYNMCSAHLPKLITGHHKFYMGELQNDLFLEAVYLLFTDKTTLFGLTKASPMT